MKTDKISILILSHNGLHRLKKTIPSIINQDYPNFDITVLDNGSNDNSQEYLSRFPEIKIIRSDRNMGLCEARNILISQASGKYIFGMDNDIELIDTNAIQNTYDSYKTLDKVAYLSPIYYNINSDKIDYMGLYFNKKQKKYPIEQVHGQGCFQVPGFNCGAFLIDKEISQKLIGFDEIPSLNLNMDDYDMSARAYIMGYKNYVSTDTLMIHHGIETRDNLMPIVGKERTYLAGFSRMILKNYRPVNILIWFPLSVVYIVKKNLNHCIKYKSLKPFISLLRSSLQFFLDLPSTIKERKKIQKLRTVKKDVFLSIPTKKF